MSIRSNKKDMPLDCELPFWRKTTYREVFGGVYSEAPAIDGWCPQAHGIADFSRAYKGLSLPSKKTVSGNDKFRASCRFQSNCVFLLLHVLKKEEEPQGCSEVELKDVQAALAPYYFKGAQNIISKITLSHGKLNFLNAGPRLTSFKKIYDLYRYCSRKLWLKLYDINRCDLTRQERADFLMSSDDAISGVWDVVTTIEGRSTISKQTFNQHMAVVGNPKGCREFIDSLAKRQGKPINKASKLDSVIDATFFKDYYNEYIVRLPVRSALEQFIKEAFVSRIKDFENRRYFIMCRNDRCNRLADYYRGKLYCSLDREGRNCRQLSWKRENYKCKK